MSKQDNFISAFKQESKVLEKFRVELEKLIGQLLTDNKIQVHQITSRLKDEGSLRNKIVLKGGKYNSLSEITDLVGVRIITYFEDVVDDVAKMIEKEFNVDVPNSVDKRKLEVDKFGYQSLHYVIKISDARSKLSEWKKFEKYSAEIQIRSILQHAWAEIQHDIGYKGDVELPISEQRNSFRIAALLETADKGFIGLRDALINYQHSITPKIKTKPESVPIDKVTVKVYRQTSTLVANLDKLIAKKLKASVKEFESIDNSLARKIQFLGITNVHTLQTKLAELKNETTKVASYWLNQGNFKEIPIGVSLFYFPQTYLATTGATDAKIKEYFDQFHKRSNSALSVTLLKQSLQELKK